MTFIAGVAFGFLAGWLAQRHISQSKVENWERSVISVVVTGMWVVSVALDVALTNYETPMAVHGVMGMVVGYFFEGSFFGKK